MSRGVRTSDVQAVPLATLTSYSQAIRAGARALREREEWCHRIHLPTDADLLHDDAQSLEELARLVERGMTRPLRDAGRGRMP